MNKTLDVQIIVSNNEEKKLLNELNKNIYEYCEMAELEMMFLNSLITRKQPKKILEIGVSKGGSSALILNAIKNINNSHLYSIDYQKECYCVKGKQSGFYVDEYPQLKEKWTLFLGGYALNYMDTIGKNIDFCFIDTMHYLPGEIFDFLMVLPYLNENAIIVFHDTNLHVKDNMKNQSSIVNNLLISAISGEKIIPDVSIQSNNGFPKYINNISAIQINKNTLKKQYEIFNLLTLPWKYIPIATDLNSFKEFLKLHYNNFYSEYFESIIKYQKQILFNIIRQNVKRH